MAHRSESAHFQALLESALRAYEKKAGVSLAEHPLALKFQNCDTVDGITAIFQDRAQTFRDLQGSDKIMKSIRTTVSILSKLSSAASLADVFGLVLQGALMICLTPLTFFCYRHSHPQRQYRLVWPSYSTYVPSSSSYIDSLVTSE